MLSYAISARFSSDRELIDFTVFEGATCEGELLREIVDKDFATGEYDTIEAPKQNLRAQVKRLAQKVLRIEHALFVKAGHISLGFCLRLINKPPSHLALQVHLRCVHRVLCPSPYWIDA